MIGSRLIESRGLGTMHSLQLAGFVVDDISCHKTRPPLRSVACGNR